jgi:hypothetical protein
MHVYAHVAIAVYALIYIKRFAGKRRSLRQANPKMARKGMAKGTLETARNDRPLGFELP